MSGDPVWKQGKPKKKPRRNDAPWRAEVIRRYGARCRACGYSVERLLEADHVMPRSQQGASDVRNGLMLCGPFAPGACHRRKTEKAMLVEPEWLEPEQIDFLREAGWVWWNDEGDPEGPGCRSFARRRR